MASLKKWVQTQSSSALLSSFVEAYIHHAFADHLSGKQTYQPLSQQDTHSEMDALSKKIYTFITAYCDEEELYYEGTNAKFLYNSLASSKVTSCH
jgi:hypothetical protein